MTETWIPWAIRAPAPIEKSGYYMISTRRLDQILFIVNHDARGYRSYLRQGHRPGENASWGMSNCTNGDLYQHFPLERMPWASGTMQANIAGWPVEHENEAGPWGVPQPWVIAPAQVATDLRLEATMRDLGCVNLGRPMLGEGRREHRILAGGATTCPNGRIQSLYDAQGGDIMAKLDQEDLLAITGIINNVVDAKLGLSWRNQGDLISAMHGYSALFGDSVGKVKFEVLGNRTVVEFLKAQGVNANIDWEKLARALLKVAGEK